MRFFIQNGRAINLNILVFHPQFQPAFHLPAFRAGQIKPPESYAEQPPGSDHREVLLLNH